MEEDENTNGSIARADVVDAITDLENEGALLLLTDYYHELSGANATIEKRISTAKTCAKMLYDAKRYEDVLVWLDEIATLVSDQDGPDSEAYMAFTEDESLETLKMNASDRSLGEEEEDDYGNDDE